MEKRGAMPSEAPTCIASDEASGNGERSSRAGLVSSCRRSAARYMPTLPSTPKALFEAVAGVAFGEQRNHVHVAFIAQRGFQALPHPCTSRPVLLAKYRFSSSVLISMKELRIQWSKASAFSLIEQYCAGTRAEHCPRRGAGAPDRQNGWPAVRAREAMRLGAARQCGAAGLVAGPFGAPLSELLVLGLLGVRPLQDVEQPFHWRYIARGGGIDRLLRQVVAQDVLGVGTVHSCTALRGRHRFDAQASCILLQPVHEAAPMRLGRLCAVVERRHQWLEVGDRRLRQATEKQRQIGLGLL